MAPCGAKASRITKRFLWPCVPLALGSLCFASWSHTRQTGISRTSREAARRYQLLPTEKLEKERAWLTQPVQREVAPSVFNPLLDELNGIPRLDQVRIEHLVSAADLVLEQFQVDLTRIQESLYKKTLQRQSLSFEEVVGPLEVLLDRLEKVWGSISFLRRAWRISPKIDEIYHGISYRISTATSILAQSEILHQALWELNQQDLSGVQRRVVTRLARDGFMMGIGIEDVETLKSMDEGQKQLVQLATRFAENVAKDEAEALLRVKSQEEIKGLPQKVLDATATDEALLEAANRREALQACLDAENPELRQHAFLASRRLGFEAGNLPVIAEMLQIRQAWASALGYKSYADLAFESRSGSKAEVEVLLETLRKSSEAAAVEELKELKAAGDLRTSDLHYFKSKRKNELVQDLDLKPFLPLSGVVRGLFRLIESLFAVKLEPATARKEVPLWHRSIRFYRLVDTKSGHPIGGLYLDLFQHGKKLSSGFWADSFVSYSKRLGQKNVARRPIAHIVGDLPPPRREQPDLLSLQQVRSLFHAAGGALRHLLNVQEEGLAGPEHQEIDAGVLPEFMEQWVLNPFVLQSFGGHWQTGESIPEKVLDTMRNSEALHVGLELFRRVSWAQLDLELHSKQDLTEDQILELARERLSSKEIGLVLPDFNDGLEEGLCGFEGPFSSGFAAGEYTAIWRQVLAADLFEAFQSQADSVSKMGQRVRELLLAPGAHASPADLIRELRGHGPKVGPFLQQLGLKRQAG